jgi:hypothetical protein
LQKIDQRLAQGGESAASALQEKTTLLQQMRQVENAPTLDLLLSGKIDQSASPAPARGKVSLAEALNALTLSFGRVAPGLVRRGLAQPQEIVIR